MANSHEASDAAREVFITAFSFLSAFLLRDIVAKLWEKLTTKKEQKFGMVILYQFLLFLLIFIITIIAAVYWNNYGTDVIG